MKKLIFYFHGYNSSAKSDKVKILEKEFDSTFAYDIDIDPEVSLKEVSNKIVSCLLDHMNDEDAKVIFVGTSLGAWYASVLAETFGADCVLINPCYSPSKMLKHHGVPDEILSKYDDMKFLENAKYFISEKDEVIDFEPVKDILNERNVSWFGDAYHRFNGPEFGSVIQYIKEI